MPLISKKSIEEIRSRADIVAFIGDYTNLSRSGAKWKGLSPFAAEKTPSFYVDPDKGFYYCFSTAQGGDIFKFLMVRENLTFGESVERVAQRFGITVEYESGGMNIDRSMRGELFSLNEFAAGYFAEQLKKDDAIAGKVRRYWVNERKFSEDVAAEFGIGFLPENGSGGLIEAALKKGFSEKAISGSGMFGGNEKVFNPRGRRIQFEARLIIPIRDIQGRVVAFTARKIPGITPDNKWEEAKYKNSSESEIFKKGAMLFNIDKAKEFYTDIERKKADPIAQRNAPFVLVEGQLDAIRSFTCGMKTVVAGQGTGITLQQIQLLARYSRALDCLLDADAAGQKAALRLAPLAFEAGVELNFLNVPGGKDPDEFLSQNGEDGVGQILATRRPAIEFISDKFFPAGTALSLAEKQDALEKIYEILAGATSEVFRSDCLEKVARRAGIERLSLERDFQTFMRKKHYAKIERAGTPLGLSAEASASGNTPLTTIEGDVLMLALQTDAILSKLAANIPPEWLDSNSVPGKILNRIIAEYSEGCWKNAKDSLPDLLESDEEKSYIAKITAQQCPFEDTGALVREMLVRICEAYCARERTKIDAELAGLSPDNPRFLELQRRRIELRKTLQNFKK